MFSTLNSLLCTFSKSFRLGKLASFSALIALLISAGSQSEATADKLLKPALPTGPAQSTSTANSPLVVPMKKTAAAAPATVNSPTSGTVSGDPYGPLVGKKFT